ncbi:MAG: aconitase X swivel domain-containing protein [Acidimicrobiia bacterium]
MSVEYRVLVEGTAAGRFLRLTEPLSLWGGFEPETGLIVDPHHPQVGQSMTRAIVAMPHGRGSSSSSSVLAEALRLGTGPAGFILESPDSILVIGSLVANRLYGTVCPIVCGHLPEGSTGTWVIDHNLVSSDSGHGTKPDRT